LEAERVDALVDRNNPAPLHLQIRQNLLKSIEDGRLPLNAKLSSERELVKLFGVSRITVRQALKDLEREGYLTSHPGKGFYVADKTKAFELDLLKSFTVNAHATNRKPGNRLLEGWIGKAPREITRPLFLPDGADVLLLKRLRFLDDQPVVIQEDWLSPVLVPGLLELDWSTGNRSLYAELHERFSIRPVRGQTILGARLLTADEAALLELEMPAAALTIDQIAYDSNNRPVNLSFTAQHPARHPLTVLHSESPTDGQHG
jgi:GntR family transcriptional regulator